VTLASTQASGESMPPSLTATLNHREFKDALGRVARIIPNRSASPGFTLVQIAFTRGAITLTGSFNIQTVSGVVQGVHHRHGDSCSALTVTATAASQPRARRAALRRRTPFLPAVNDGVSTEQQSDDPYVQS